jgi:hypothetical protein
VEGPVAILLRLVADQVLVGPKGIDNFQFIGKSNPKDSVVMVATTVAFLAVLLKHLEVQSNFEHISEGSIMFLREFLADAMARSNNEELDLEAFPKCLFSTFPLVPFLKMISCIN